MPENKTIPNNQNVEAFLSSIENPEKQADSRILVMLMSELTGRPAVMWGDSIIGFGQYHYKYASGREGDWFLTGFSPRNQNLTIYVKGYLENYGSELAGLGKFSHGKGCLYIKKLSDIDLDGLRNLIEVSLKNVQNR